MMPLVTKPMCLTEEYAIKDLRSVWRIQINLVIQAPIKDTLIIKEEILGFKFIKFAESRKRPYPPSLRRTPAKIMEPATGASTCALGSHR